MQLKERFPVNRHAATSGIKPKRFGLLPMGNIQPINERQARPLTKLGTKQLQQEAWQKVADRLIRSSNVVQNFDAKGISKGYDKDVCSLSDFIIICS